MYEGTQEPHNLIDLVNPIEFHAVMKKMREFYESRGLIEGFFAHRFNPLGILAACENPFNIATSNYMGMVWPKPQTGQMWLEYELLTRPQLPGLSCMTPSFRQEPDPIPGRHNLAFPMSEFELHGDFATLLDFLNNLVRHLGFGSTADFPIVDYDAAAREFGIQELEAEHERMLCEKHGPVVFLVRFPEHTSPFWNMKRIGDHAQKCDVLLHGIETIGSAERSCDPEDMRRRFYAISDGAYAKKLFGEFTRERVERELNFFLALPMIERFGGGIGMTRMIRALKMQGTLFA